MFGWKKTRGWKSRKIKGHQTKNRGKLILRHCFSTTRVQHSIRTLIALTPPLDSRPCVCSTTWTWQNFRKLSYAAAKPMGSSSCSDTRKKGLCMVKSWHHTCTYRYCDQHVLTSYGQFGQLELPRLRHAVLAFIILDRGFRCERMGQEMRLFGVLVVLVVVVVVVVVVQSGGCTNSASAHEYATAQSFARMSMPQDALDM